MKEVITLTRHPKVPQLFGASEVAEAIGVSQTNLQFIKDLPEPVQKIRASRLWLADEILVFAEIYQVRQQKRGEHHDDDKAAA